MNPDQLNTMVMQNARDISALWESSKSAHKRIDENDRVTEGIYKLASSVESLTMQVKQLAEKMDSSLEKIENRQRDQGERIGALEKEPGQNWKRVTAQISTIIIAAIIGMVLGKMGLM